MSVLFPVLHHLDDNLYPAEIDMSGFTYDLQGLCILSPLCFPEV